MSDGDGLDRTDAITHSAVPFATSRSGEVAMSVSLLAFGAASYGFLAMSGRALGPDAFAPLSVLYSAVYLVGSGLFVPFEQELTRSIAANRASGDSMAAAVRATATVAAATFIGAAAITAALSPYLADHLFRGQPGFVIVLVVGIGAVGLTFFCRGLLAGSGRYHRLAVLFLTDAAVKLIGSGALLAAGVREPLAYGAVLAISCFVGALLPLSGLLKPRRAGLSRAKPAPISSLGYLLLASFFSSLTINVGTIAVEALADESEAKKTGVFLSGLMIARIPLFLSQAMQALLLPRLSVLVATGRSGELRPGLRRLGAMMALATAAAVLAAAVAGPYVVRLMFGSDFDLLESADMALLALASMLGMCALTANQAQIALHNHHQTWWPWATASAIFVLTTALSSFDLYRRVEIGLVAATGVATALSTSLLNRTPQRGAA